MKHNIGDIITGTVSGIKNYGIFIKFEDIFGFCHISNCSNKFVNNLNELFKVNDKVTVKILEFSNDRLNVSIKACEKLENKKNESNDNQKKFIQDYSVVHKKSVSNKQSFEDMLKVYLKKSDERLDSIGKRNQKHKKR